MMLKKTILLSIFAVSLTGCVVAPFDDHPRSSYGYGQSDRDHRSKGNFGKDRPNMQQQKPNWQNGQRPHWDKGKQRPEGQQGQRRP